MDVVDVGALPLAQRTREHLESIGVQNARQLMARWVSADFRHALDEAMRAELTAVVTHMLGERARAATAQAVLSASQAAGGGAPSQVQPPADAPMATSALSLLSSELGVRRILTKCRELDEILGGGGLPGIGKTQIGIQLALSVQLPTEFGGLGGKAIYIDTEGSVLLDRVREMATALVGHVSSLASACGDTPSGRQALAASQSFTVDKLLAGIYYYPVFSCTEQLALVHLLTGILSRDRDIRLVVFDSVSFLFRQIDEFDDMRHRTRVLNGLAQSLSHLARTCRVAVVTINQVTTKGAGATSVGIAAAGAAASSSSTAATPAAAGVAASLALVPALGESWSHACTHRIVLYWSGGERYAHVHKSSVQAARTAAFAVTRAGIASVERKHALGDDAPSSESRRAAVS